MRRLCPRIAKNGTSPATKADLQALERNTKADLQAIEERIDQRMEKRLTALEDKLVETMRDMQTELLRGFAAHISGLTVRMRKLEADQSNLDTAMSPRLAALEQQVTEMNIRLMQLEMR